jgi:hypothetical protein
MFSGRPERQDLFKILQDKKAKGPDGARAYPGYICDGV